MLTSDLAALILASGSPRRRELLERFVGPEHLQIMVPDYDESAAGKGCANPRELVCLLAAGKLKALHTQFQLPVNYFALAADTLVVLDDQVLGKPADSDDAVRMLGLLSGRTHQVITGISLEAGCEGRTFSLQAAEVTDVRFARLTETQIQWYAATGEPLDKAGAYGIQGFGAALVRQIDGCYYNVMGLPVNRLMDMLQTAADHFSSNSSFAYLLPWN